MVLISPPHASLLTSFSEIFGVSEDESAFDHSADADNGRTQNVYAAGWDSTLNKDY
jgi:hypothetical protein